MRGSRSTTAEKILKGTVNTTREKAGRQKATNANPEVASYLTKTKEILDVLWNKISDVKTSTKDLETYSRLFIMYQKHYFTFSNLLPKEIKSNDIIGDLINSKEL